VSKIPLQRQEERQNDPSLDPGWSSIQENKKCYINEPIGNGENKYPAGRDKPSDTNKMDENTITLHLFYVNYTGYL
jgi:hypothetical protein